jgi:nucleotide-binding universal stress UspA family protein
MYKDILLPVDMSDEKSWRPPLTAALEMSRQFGSRLHVMTVVGGFDFSMVESFFPADYEMKMREQFNKQLHEFVAQHIPQDITVQTIVAVGPIAKQILEYADQLKCDLIVMGRTSETSGGSFLLGSNAGKVVNHARIPVLVTE